MFNVPSTTKVIWGHCSVKVTSGSQEKPGIKPPTPDLQGEWLIDYTAAARRYRVKK